MNPITFPIQPARAHEGIFEPDDEDRADYAARPMTRLVDATGANIVTAHDFFTFRPGHAEELARRANAFDVLTGVLEGLLAANLTTTPRESVPPALASAIKEAEMLLEQLKG